MALKAPKNFNFQNPAEWPTWKRHFLRYHEACELDKKSEAVQTTYLIYTMGPEADRLLDQFTMSEADKKQER